MRHAASEGDKIETAEEIQQIYSFAAGDINTEVWFVALGSELANNGGIKAFLAEHAPEMRGAVIVNLEALGGGTLSYLEREGDLSQAKCSPRMKRFIKKASQRPGVQLASASIDWKESPASYAAKHRMQAVSLVGMDGYAPGSLRSSERHGGKHRFPECRCGCRFRCGTAEEYLAYEKAAIRRLFCYLRRFLFSSETNREVRG